MTGIKIPQLGRDQIVNEIVEKNEQPEPGFAAPQRQVRDDVSDACAGVPLRSSA